MMTRFSSLGGRGSMQNAAFARLRDSVVASLISEWQLKGEDNLLNAEIVSNAAITSLPDPEL